MTRPGPRLLAASAAGWLTMGVPAGLGMATVLPVARMARPLDPHRELPHRVANAVWGRAAFLAPWWSLTVVGRHHVPSPGPCLLCANHQSFMDVPAMHGLGLSFKWVMDHRFARVPLLARWIRAAGYVTVDPADPRSSRAMLDAVAAWLDRGLSVALFPEGTRSRDGAVGAFLRGPFRVAHDTGAPVVPVAIRGTREVLPPDRWTSERPPPWSIRLRVMEPLWPGRTPGDLRRGCRAAVIRGLAELDR